MRKVLIAFSALVLLALPACGGNGGDDGNGNGTPDAGGGTPDASSQPDAGGSMLMGLGETCDPNNPMCPQNAPGCLGFQGATQGFCTDLCGDAGTVEISVNADGSIADITGTDEQLCMDIYSGSTGTPACLHIIDDQDNTLPPDPQNRDESETYTANMACGILCAQTSPQCPGDLTCDQGACVAP